MTFNVYVLTAIEPDAEYNEMDFIVGIFSSQEKAEEIRDTKAQEIFGGCEFNIEEWEVDDFSWHRAI